MLSNIAYKTNGKLTIMLVKWAQKSLVKWTSKIWKFIKNISKQICVSRAIPANLRTQIRSPFDGA